MKISSLCLTLAVASVAGANVVPDRRPEPRADFAGYHIIEATANSQEALDILRQLERAEVAGLEFWSHPAHADIPFSISVQPELVTVLKEFLDANNVTHATVADDLQSLIDEEMKGIEAEFEAEFDGELSYRDPSASYYVAENYNDLRQITLHMREIRKSHPGIVSISSIGTTAQGRSIDMVTLSAGNTKSAGIWLDCGIHAREWVSPAFCVYTVKKLAEQGVNGPLGKFDFYIVPVANPDGYKYSWETNRMWRKNRSPCAKSNDIAQQQQQQQPQVEEAAAVKQFWGQQQFPQQQFPQQQFPGNNPFGGFGGIFGQQQQQQQQQQGFAPLRPPHSPGKRTCEGVGKCYCPYLIHGPHF